MQEQPLFELKDIKISQKVDPDNFAARSKPKIHLDSTVRDMELFKSKEEFEICKPEIFKYGIMMEEVPAHIREAPALVRVTTNQDV